MSEIELPSPKQPGKVAKELLARHVHDGKPTRLYVGGTWWDWRGTHWSELDAKEHWSELTKILNRAVFGNDRENWNPDTRTQNHVLRQLEGLGYADPDSMRLDGRRLVACQNGLLDVRTRELLPPDPGYFNMFAVPFAYDPQAGEPSEFEKFLHSLWPDDPEAQAVVWEWFAYVLSGRTDLHKILMIIGPPRSGKGTLLRVLSELIGMVNMTTVTFARFSTEFGMSSMVGKTLAAITDAHATKGKTEEAVERMKSISGEDHQTINRKYKEFWEGRLPTRLMVLSNSVPVLHDASGAMASRFIVLRMLNSFEGREDTDLERRLLAELPAILNKVLDAMETLQERGRFAEPASSKAHRRALEAAVSPIKEWAEHSRGCVIGKSLEVDKKVLLDAYNVWRSNNGKSGDVSAAQFGRDLVSLYPQVEAAERGKKGTKNHRPVYLGVDVTPPFI